MELNENIIRFVQIELEKKGFSPGLFDGVLGPKTIAALDKVKGIPVKWSPERKAVGFIQLLAKEYGLDPINIDGYWGPITDYIFEELKHIIRKGEPMRFLRPEDIVDVNPNNWPRQTPDQNLIEFYGEPGSHLVDIKLPYPHRLAWRPEKFIQSFQCHEKVHDSLKRVLTRVFEHYGLQEIRKLGLDLWGGCFCIRKMRGGKRLSTHSWGIAVDYHPDKNKLRWGRERALFSKPEYDAWWSFWEEEGWVSLGRQRNFDWMHIQAAKI